MDIAAIQEVLSSAGVVFDPGMSEEEMLKVEEEFGFRFPPDLKSFLSYGLPISRSCVDWRRGDRQVIRDRLALPLEGILFDIDANDFWHSEWGPKPTSREEAHQICRRAVADAPVLIPICSHRFIPATPNAAGNPIFSVHQTDIIYYGFDLADYMMNEFSYYFGRKAYAISGTPKRIPFWSNLVS